MFPLHSWKHSAPTSLIAAGNSRRQVYEHLPNGDVHQRRGRCWFYSRARGEGNPLKTSLAQPLHKHSPPPTRHNLRDFSIILRSACDNATLSALEKLTESFFPPESAGVKRSHRRSFTPFKSVHPFTRSKRRRTGRRFANLHPSRTHARH